MSQQWAQVSEMPADYRSKVSSTYSDIFPILIRDNFSVWIEEQPWNQIDENDDSHRTEYALPLLKDLLQLIQNKAKVIPDYEDHLFYIRNITSQSHEEIIEGSILQISEEFQNVNARDAGIAAGLKELQKKEEEFVISFRELPKVTGESSNYASCHVTFDMFCKDNLREDDFTFWDLFYSTMRLTKDELYVPWKKGNIAGFISKAKAEMCLKDSSPGNFICRFSATLLGGVSISYSSGNGVHHTSPFTCKDLQKRSLPLLIMDTPKWTHLYPNKPKKHVFGTNSDDSPKTDGKNEYEKFIWTIKMNSSEEEQEDITDQACGAALTELIDDTDVDRFLRENFEDEMIL